jgi:hypothetical protein
MSGTILHHDSLSPPVSYVPFHPRPQTANISVRITTDKMSHAATPPMVFADRGTHQSVLQRFHPIKLDVAGSIPNLCRP